VQWWELRFFEDRPPGDEQIRQLTKSTLEKADRLAMRFASREKAQLERKTDYDSPYEGHPEKKKAL